MKKIPQLLGLLLAIGIPACQSHKAAPLLVAPQFVKVASTHFEVGGKPYYLAGCNYHYLQVGTHGDVDRALGVEMAGMHLNTARIFAFWEDGPIATEPNPNHMYYQYWDPVSGTRKFNDGDTGFKQLDYLIYKAGQSGIRLLLVLGDDHAYHGGVLQYLDWLGYSDATDHELFFTDPRFRALYKGWIEHVVNRTNSFTGVQYKNDPTIFGWDLINEPTQLTAEWTADIATYLHGLDTNHVVALGGYNLGITGAQPGIDFIVNHCYPEYECPVQPASWGQDAWLPNQIAWANSVNKPFVVEEFGTTANGKDVIYDAWLRKLESLKGAGWLFWDSHAKNDAGVYENDSENFAIELTGQNSYVVPVLKAAADRIKVTVPAPPEPPTQELLLNAGFEDITTEPWAMLQDTPNDGTLSLITSPVHGGTRAAWITGRTKGTESIQQDVTLALNSKGSGTYTLQAWTRLGSGTDNYAITLKVTDAAGTSYYSSDSFSVGGSYVELSKTLPVVITGTVTEAILFIDPWTYGAVSTADLYVDDFSLQKK